jgi:hypothetical protein
MSMGIKAIYDPTKGLYNESVVDGQESVDLTSANVNVDLVNGDSFDKVKFGFRTVRSLTTSDNILQTDRGGLIVMNSVSSNSLTVNHGICNPGEIVTVFVRGVGVTSVVTGSNIDLIIAPNSTAVSTGKGAWLQLVKIESSSVDVWALSGHLETT